MTTNRSHWPCLCGQVQLAGANATVIQFGGAHTAYHCESPPALPPPPPLRSIMLDEIAASDDLARRRGSPSIEVPVWAVSVAAEYLAREKADPIVTSIHHLFVRLLDQPAR